jgi:hypothetical protein
MTLSRNDLAATALTALAVVAFLATHEGWNVWLVGDSHRWAAGVILALGLVACGLGSPGRGAATKFLAMLGVLALVLAVSALATGSLTPLSLLVVVIVVLWAVSTLRHVGHGHGHGTRPSLSA